MSDETEKAKRREFSGWMGSAEAAAKREQAEPARRRGRPPVEQPSEGGE